MLYDSGINEMPYPVTNYLWARPAAKCVFPGFLCCGNTLKTSLITHQAHLSLLTQGTAEFT